MPKPRRRGRLLAAPLLLLLAAAPARAGKSVLLKIGLDALLSTVTLGIFPGLSSTPDYLTPEQVETAVKANLLSDHLSEIQRDTKALLEKAQGYAAVADSVRLEQVRTLLRESVVLQKRLKVNIQDEANPGSFHELMPSYVAVVGLRVAFWLERDRLQPTPNTKHLAAAVAVEALQELKDFYTTYYRVPNWNSCIEIQGHQEVHSKLGLRLSDEMTHGGKSFCRDDPDYWADSKFGHKPNWTRLPWDRVAQVVKEKGKYPEDLRRCYDFPGPVLDPTIPMYPSLGGPPVPKTAGVLRDAFMADCRYFDPKIEVFQDDFRRQEWCFSYPVKGGDGRVQWGCTWDRRKSLGIYRKAILSAHPDTIGDLVPVVENLKKVAVKYGSYAQSDLASRAASELIAEKDYDAAQDNPRYFQRGDS